MKIVAVNGGPRKGKNTDQLLDAFLEGVKEASPEAEVEIIRLFDYEFAGCRACYACQLKQNREDLGCRAKDKMTELLRDTFHADGIVFTSPIYYGNMTGHLRSFLERLMYPGVSRRKVPTSLIFTMGMPEERKEQFLGATLQGFAGMVGRCFGEESEVVTSCNTFNYNENSNYDDAFIRGVEEKKAFREEHFAQDLQAAKEAGARLVERVKV